MFKSKDTYSASSETKIFGLTTDTSNALHITLNGIFKLITLPLTNIKYALTVKFQSDRIEGEFGIHRQLSINAAGNYTFKVI